MGEVMLHGIHIGEHEYKPEKVIGEIKERCIDEGFNYVVIRTHSDVETQQEYFLEWAKYLAENRIYFMFLYSIKTNSTGELRSVFTEETAKKMKEIAGEYFMGDLLGEPGSGYTFKGKGYFIPSHPKKPVQNVPDIRTAKDNYVNFVSGFVDLDKSLGINDVACVAATAELPCGYVFADNGKALREISGTQKVRVKIKN